MIIDKKRIFLYSSILLLILAGVYYTVFVESVGFVDRNPLSTNVNATTESNGTQNGVCTFYTNNSKDCRALYSDLPNWTRGGNSELFVFKINISNISNGVIGNRNVTRINITLPTGFGSLVRQGQVAALANASFNQNAARILNSSGSTWAGSWTINTTDAYVTVFNESSLAVGISPNLSSMQMSIFTETIFINFNATARNGTEEIVNWTIHIYNTTGGGTIANIDSGLGLLIGIDGLPPRLNTTLGINVTDGINVRTSFTSTQYLRYDPGNPIQGVNFTISVNDYNVDRVLLIYNNTGGTFSIGDVRGLLYNSTFLTLTNQSGMPGVDHFNLSVIEGSSTSGSYQNKSNMTSLDGRSDVRNGPNNGAPGYMFSFNISNVTWGQGATDGTTFNYVFVVYDLYNNSEVINNSNTAYYTIARDTNTPTATLTSPTDTTIGVFDPIKYTCDGSDTSGVASCTLTSTKPGGTVITKTGCGTQQTFTTTDTNEAGTYNVKCEVQDNVGRLASQSSTFSVSAGGGAGAGGGGGGGGGGGSAGSSAENPVTVQTGESIDAGTLSTSETFTSVAKEGTVTFTVSGSSHSVKVLEVTTDSVTIEISSTPKQVTLTIGETKEVDVDDDGKNDLSVTLKSITNEKADLVFKSLEVSIPAGEEQPPTGPGEGVVTGEEAKTSLTWLWALIIIVVVIVVWVLLKKKR